MTARKTVFWLAIILLPVVALWSYALIAALQGYDRICGLMNGGDGCTIRQFIDDQILNAFVAPGLIAATAWLLIVAGAAVIYVLVCMRRANSAA